MGEAKAVVIEGTSLYVIGFDSAGTAGSFRWRIEKRDLTTGALVTTFGANGAATSEPGAFWDEPEAVAVDASYLYVTGYAETSNWEWRIEKRLK
jgi:hypothetical protein